MLHGAVRWFLTLVVDNVSHYPKISDLIITPHIAMQWCSVASLLDDTPVTVDGTCRCSWMKKHYQRIIPGIDDSHYRYVFHITIKRYLILPFDNFLCYH